MMKKGHVEEAVVPTYCPECGKELAPSERLVCAILQEVVKCYECCILSKRLKCTKCGEPIENVFHYDDKPYHAGCLPYA